ncbi:MAG TPA: hypothetical protein DCL77_06025, partial [Prolixibacteraceae bacterium]|nr:hypothetical protein [Prolixibacteraceae bacterium]
TGANIEDRRSESRSSKKISSGGGKLEPHLKERHGKLIEIDLAQQLVLYIVSLIRYILLI